MRSMQMRPPGFPVVPFLFPMGLMMTLLLTVLWLQYRTWRRLNQVHPVDQDASEVRRDPGPW